MHKSFSVQKTVKKVIWERDSRENYQRVKGKNHFSLYLHTCLFAEFLAQELCTLSFLEAFSCYHECSKTSQYAAHMVTRGSKLLRRKFNYQAEPWKHRTYVFSLLPTP